MPVMEIADKQGTLGALELYQRCGPSDPAAAD